MTYSCFRLAGKPAVFDGEDARIEFVATEESQKEAELAMGVLFRNVELDTILGRMLDKKMQRRSWASGVNVGRLISMSVVCVLPKMFFILGKEIQLTI